ncbi:hypothetical protein [Botrimarina hoheduenensis]|uniref:SnoaL-like domain-containing protein n=1 Tax=Botrimarina hoheduenensis TaxID=2528000 RepID=A0A5C5WE51_9BACT|nr:hypothetical protein [Botrimarina hoheduenensis]TWT48339.1 hypothetical protein Pla111_01020 [Botrimarina hoheduenensis]
MAVLLESPTLVAAIGLFLLTATGIFYTQSRSLGALISVGVAVLLTAGGLIAERSIVTSAEAVRAEVHDLFDAIADNDLPAVIALLDPAASNMQADAQTLMPMFRVLSAGEGGRVRVAINDNTATAELKPVIKVTHQSTGATGVYFDGLTLRLVKRDDRWRFTDYTAAEDWRKGAAKLSR